MGKNQDAWIRLFEKHAIRHEIEKNGFFEISAGQIKKYREPRLMTKFDRSSDLPEVFSKDRLSILPVTRSSYVIGHFDAYHALEAARDSLTRRSLPAYVGSLDPHAVASEAIALNCAFASGILADFAEDETLIPTVSGRMSSGKFSFSIDDTETKRPRRLNVDRSQIEIDAAYEGKSCLLLLEAKMERSKDFLVRQLYYPFRAWKERVTKPVRPVFLVYSEGVYRLYEYEFQNPDHYNSLTLVRQRNYTVAKAMDRDAVLDCLLRRYGSKGYYA